MASVDRINREIAQLEEATQAIAQEFRTAYTQYLTLLAKAMQQQLILACFRLCTQGYPDRFLKLSFDERQTLQQALRQVGQQAIEQLMLPLQGPSDEVDEGDEAASEGEELEEMPIEPPDVPPTNELEEMLMGSQAERDQAAIEAESGEAEEADSEAEDEDEFEDEFEIEVVQLRFDQPIPPKALQQWREGVEANVAIVLRTISQAANHLLHQAKILPKPLPPVLEVAAGIMAESASSTPNLLNLLIETEDQDETKMTQIIAIRLRLAEIEFAEPGLATGRSQIRSLAARLQQLERNYRKKQRDRAVAEAEAAWRSSWFEE